MLDVIVPNTFTDDSMYVILKTSILYNFPISKQKYQIKHISIIYL